MHLFIRQLKPDPSRWIEADAEEAAMISLLAGDGIVPHHRHFSSRDRGLRVMVSVSEIQGAQWMHLSISRSSRIPSYEDMARAKSDFIGDGLVAYQVFPKRSEHRNTHATCLHLWCPLSADPFPDPLGERADAVGNRPEDDAEWQARFAQCRDMTRADVNRLRAIVRNGGLPRQEAPHAQLNSNTTGVR